MPARIVQVTSPRRFAFLLSTSLVLALAAMPRAHALDLGTATIAELQDAMDPSQPDRDAFVIDRLRKAGAIILGKLNQSDWYGNAPLGGSTLKGPVLSPYNPAKSPGGSSSGTGSAMAAWFGTVGLGSDTTGSIVIPSTLANLVGFSTTHGLVSRTGWQPPRFGVS